MYDGMIDAVLEDPRDWLIESSLEEIEDRIHWFDYPESEAELKRVQELLATKPWDNNPI